MPAPPSASVLSKRLVEEEVDESAPVNIVKVFDHLPRSSLWVNNGGVQ